MGSPDSIPGRRLGRYLLFEPIASGGMATVHFGRMIGPAGFARTVAIKRLHPHLATDPQFVAMFLDEARLAARVQHPNVVSTIDVISEEGEVFLVMDYVKGESLAGLMKEMIPRGETMPPAVAASIVSGALHGLHAAHEATGDGGEPLLIVHRDVSPQNILVGADGVARIVDFGVAKAAWRIQSTKGGEIKGKLSYMSPEQLQRQPVERRTDVYAAAVVLWEALAGRKLFAGDEPGGIVTSILTSTAEPPSEYAATVPVELDRVVSRGLSRDASTRYPTALAMASAIEEAIPLASQGAVASWVREQAADRLAVREKRLALIEAAPADSHVRARAGSVTVVSPGDIARLSDMPTASESPPAATAESAAPRRGRRGLVVGVSMSALVVTMAAAGVLVFGRRVRADSPPAQTSSATPVSASSSVSDDRAAPSLDSAGVPASSPPPTAIPAHSTPSRPSARPSRPAVSPRKDCDPPYVIDPSSVSPDGQPLRRFKPWCL